MHIVRTLGVVLRIHKYEAGNEEGGKRDGRE